MALSIRLEDLHATEEIGPSGTRCIPLNWLVRQTTNATSATLDDVSGLVTGRRILHPLLKTKTYVPAARDANGQVSRRVHVTVS
jgi:hypothetical protein